MSHAPPKSPSVLPLANAPVESVQAKPKYDWHLYLLWLTEITARLCIGLTVLVALLVLVGWTLNNDTLIRVLPDSVAMSPITAAAMLVAAVSLLLQRVSERGGTVRTIGQLLALAVILVGADKFQGLFTGQDFGIDQWLFPARLAGNRIAPTTALNFLLIGISLILLHGSRPWVRHAAQALAGCAGATSLVGILGYVYRAYIFYSIGAYNPMALHTAICFLLMCTAILCAYPDSGLVRLLTSDSAAGSLLRRSLPATIIVPVTLGLLRLEAVRWHLFDAEVGVAVLVVATIGIFGIIAWSNAKALEGSDDRRHIAEMSLAAERNLLRTLIDSLPDSVFVKDLEGRYMIDNVAHAQFVGKDKREIEGRTVKDFFPPEVARRFAEDDKQVIGSGEPLLSREERAVDGHGRAVWLATTKIPIRDTQGRPVGIVCVSRDITQRRRNEQEMLQLQNFLFSIIENIPMMVFVKDAVELRFIRLNHAGEDLLGIAREELLGKNDYDFFPREQADFFTANDRAVLSSGTVVDIPAEVIQTRRGPRTLHTKKLPILTDGVPRYLLGISEDITDRVANEDQLREQNVRLMELALAERQATDALKTAQGQMLQTEKLAALGELVAGVAHEINNPLSFVSNNVAVLGRDIEALRRLLDLYRSTDSELVKHAPDVAQQIADLSTAVDLPYTLSNLNDLMARSKDGLKRIQQIVKDLRDFARLDEADLQDADLNSGIESTVNIIRGRAKDKNITLEIDLQPLPPVPCYPAKINQVVMNLVSNAIDACSKGGWVTVRSRAIDKTAVQIDVADNGSGIDPSVRDRLFDPFVTTKPQGQGTGLGLSISYGIVRDHGGTIAVESEPGKGAMFRVTLPADRAMRMSSSPS